MEEGEMRKVTGLSVLGILVMLVGILPAWAQQCPTNPFSPLTTCAQVQYHGGPILENWTIYPIYFGNWTKADIDAQQEFLTNLAEYISGENAPPGQQPTLWQYGPRTATVAPAATANATTSPDQYTSTCNVPPPGTSNPPATLWDCDITQIIADNQKSHNLEQFGPERQIVVFPAPGFKPYPSCNCGGYHHSLSDSSFYAVVYDMPSGGPVYAGAYFQGVTSHEIFEGATDPAQSNFFGWVTVSCQVNTRPCPSPSAEQINPGNLDEEVADQCDTLVTPNWPGFKLQFAAIVDNTLDGACTTTGYMPLDETTMYKMSPADFDTQNQNELDMGYQLYILQSYVLSNGDRYYNAVWRPQAPGTAATAEGGPATGLYHADQMVDPAYPAGAPEVAYYLRFKSLQKEGWRLYTLQTVVQNSSPLYYTAVWRRGTSVVDTKENGYFGITYKQFRAEYESNFPSPNDWRLYDLQTSIEAGSDWIDAVWHQPDGPSYLSANNVPPTPCNCSDELHIYGGTFEEYMNDYNEFYPQGFRLYILDPYVTADGKVRYNAIWRSTRTYEEVPIYGKTLEEYQSEYENELKNGFYLYILSVYVLPGDHVRYDAVFRKGMFDRPL
jgi:Bacterial tandem repeat domain 1